MGRDFLFMSGESGLTLKAAFRRDNWSHTCNAVELVNNRDGTIRRANQPHERLRGVIYYADVFDQELAAANLDLLATAHHVSNNRPYWPNAIAPFSCWPNAGVLRMLSDRHSVLRLLYRYDLTTHAFWQGERVDADRHVMRSGPLVIKAGNHHRGDGKFLVQRHDPLPDWEGVATVEPFFEGESVRVLIVGGYHWCLRVTNDTTWVKNHAGADVEFCDAPGKMVDHADEVARALGLDVCGVDYILDDNGRWYLLEANQFPGLPALDDEMEDDIMQFLDGRMQAVEDRANG